MKPFWFCIFLTFFVASSSGGQEQPLQNSAAAQFRSLYNYGEKLDSNLPSLALQDANGNRVYLKSFAGKKLFINLWATWCLPCRAEIPAIEKLYRSADKNKAAFLLISMDDNFEQAKSFARRKKLSVPIYYPLDSLPGEFRVQGIPATFIFNEKGELQQAFEGAFNFNTPVYRTYFGTAN